MGGGKHYRLLGVGAAATGEEIRSAYRRLAVRLHPDKGGACENFAELQEAYAVLSDPARRRRYDAEVLRG